MTFREIIRYWAYFLLVIGGIGFSSGYLASRGFLDDIIREFPLAPTGVTVNQQENIFVALEFYGMIQVYNRNGRFKTSFRVPNANGQAFRMRPEKNGNLTVAVQKTSAIHTFNADGELIQTRKDQVLAFEKFPENQEIILPNQIRYFISSGIFYPEIQRQKLESTDKQAQTVVRIPDHLRLFKGGFPAWLFWFFGVILLAFSTKEFSQKLFQSKPATAHIKQTKNQTTITILQDIDGHFAEAATLVFFTALWIYGGYLVLNHAFLVNFTLIRTFFYFVLGAIWLIGLRQILVGILWLSDGKETIFINTKNMKISREAIFLRNTKTFLPDLISDIVILPPPQSVSQHSSRSSNDQSGGQIRFRYQRRYYQFGKNLTYKDLKLIFTTLKKAKPLKPIHFKASQRPSFWKQFWDYMVHPK